MITYKKVEKQNIKELASLAYAIWHEYWTCILSPEQIDENYTYYFIIQDGQKAGYFGISNKKDYLFLSKLYIQKDFRHKGLGTKAFKEIKQLANGKKIQLTVNKHNINSINAYKKWGFKTIDSVVTDIGSGFVMDDYIMEA